MIKGNRIIAGYGTLAVGGYSNTNMLTIRHIQPPKEIGSDILDEFETLGVVSVPIDCKSYFELKRALEEVSAEQPIFNFGDWIFDFSQFNEKSVEVFRKQLDYAFNTLPFAC